jgi:hypothetical protein
MLGVPRGSGSRKGAQALRKAGYVCSIQSLDAALQG